MLHLLMWSLNSKSCSKKCVLVFSNSVAQKKKSVFLLHDLTCLWIKMLHLLLWSLNSKSCSKKCVLVFSYSVAQKKERRRVFSYSMTWLFVDKHAIYQTMFVQRFQRNLFNVLLSAYNIVSNYKMVHYARRWSHLLIKIYLIFI